MMDGVKMFLTDLGMLKYYEMFKIKGFDDESDIPYLTTFDLEDTIMVTNLLDRTTILSHARLYRPRPEHAVHAWLCSNSLNYYYIGFLQSELNDLGKISQLNLPNEDLYDELEIVLPGHRKRLERAVQRLKLEHNNERAAETPVSHGWWGKPECLPQAKFDFLCVRASLFSSRDSNNSAAIDFMVDSGSDVSTVQEDTLKTLNLDLIGPIYSCGIHGGNHTNLYKGRLKVGDQELDIEVMGSNYDSLGSRVVRHFRHVIDGHQHIWLKGNYSDPLPAIVAIEYPVGASPSQQNGRQQAALPIAGAYNSELSHGSLEKVTRTLGTDGEGVISENHEMFPKSATTSSDVPPEHLQYLRTGQSTSHTQSSSKTVGSHYPETEYIAKFKKPSNSHPLRSSISVLSSHHKHSSSGSKRKQTFRCNRKDLIKSSLNRQYYNSKSSVSQVSMPKLPHDTGDKPSHSFKTDIRDGEGVSSVLAENSAGKSTTSDSDVISDTRMSFCSILPSTLRDTDDDIDHLGGPESVNAASIFTQKQKFSNCSLGKGIEIFKFEPDIKKKSLERFSNSQYDQTSCYNHQENSNGLAGGSHDVVHIDGLTVENIDDVSSSAPESSCSIFEMEKKLEMNFIPASGEIKEIHLEEPDMSVMFVEGDIFHETSIYESPRKIARFEHS